MTRSSEKIHELDLKRFIKENVFALNQSQSVHPGKVGIESEIWVLERTPAHKPQLLKSTYSLEHIRDLLTIWSKKQHYKVKPSYPGSIRWNNGGSLSFEPGGQIEYSSKPFHGLSPLFQAMTAAKEQLKKAFSPTDTMLVQLGVNPWYAIQDLELQITRPRYVAMHRYFQAHSPSGIHMMRRTCSTQICLDFGNTQKVAGLRYLASLLLAPFSAAIFANSPNWADSEPILSQRNQIWQDTDPSRTGLPGLPRLVELWNQGKPDLLLKAAVDSYWTFALEANVIYLPSYHYHMPPEPTSMKEWIAHGIDGQFPSLLDAYTHISLLFPEVRPKGFLELRSMDAQSEPWEKVPALFYVALLYDPSSLDKALKLLCELYMKGAFDREPSRFGLRSPMYREYGPEIMRIALSGLQRLSDHFVHKKDKQDLQTFAEHFTFRSRTPADDWLDIGKNSFNMQTYDAQMAAWVKLGS